MAWLYIRKRSPFWWIGFPKKTGLPAQSTGLRYDDPAQTRQANEILRLAQAEEKFAGGRRQTWSQWVPEFIQQRYGASPANLKSYTNRWKALSAFLDDAGVEYPRDLTAQHAWDYVTWRTRDGKRSGGIRKARKNTALEELKWLRLLMRQAVALGYVHRSVIEGVRMPHDPRKEKPEIAPEHLPVIWQALQSKPEWMRVQFQIGYYTGCRIAETNIPLRYADLDRREIHFPTAKGGKPYTIPMPKELEPLFRKLKRDRAPEARAFDPDCDERTMSVRWCEFFKALGMPYSFHCLRVSFVSRCARSGLPEHSVMRLVRHASASVHRLYLRIRAQDLRVMADTISHPSLEPAENQGEKESTPEPPARPDTER